MDRGVCTNTNSLLARKSLSKIRHLLQAMLSSEKHSIFALSLATWQLGFCEFKVHVLLIQLLLLHFYRDFYI